VFLERSIDSSTRFLIYWTRDTTSHFTTGNVFTLSIVLLMADKIHRHVLISVMSNSQYLDINSAHLAFFLRILFSLRPPKFSTGVKELLLMVGQKKHNYDIFCRCFFGPCHIYSMSIERCQTVRPENK